jgi:ssDNA-binding replication factor A large subunit
VHRALKKQPAKSRLVECSIAIEQVVSVSFVVAVVVGHYIDHLERGEGDYKEVEHSFVDHYAIRIHCFPSAGHYCPSPCEAYSCCYPS